MRSMLSTLAVLLLFARLNGQRVSGKCSRLFSTTSDKRGFIFNNNYPEVYHRDSECEWNVNSKSPMKLYCDPFDLPSSTNCERGALILYDGATTTGKHYCGNNTLRVVTKSTEVTINLTFQKFPPAGKFYCTIEDDESTNNFDVCACGGKNAVDAPVTEEVVLQPSITGGVETQINDYPMVSGLFDWSLKRHFCGATIINRRQVLTAAHCLTSKQITEMRVVVGEHDWSTGQDYDIAVVNIFGEMTFNKRVGPACLPFQHRRNTFDRDFVEILGWGSTEFAGAPSRVLRKAQVGIVNNAVCSQIYKSLSSRQLCTNGAVKDSCQFDSGGPVLWKNPNSGRIVVIGIISLGGACGDGEPAVNTRVSAFIRWLVRQTPSAISYCTKE